MKKRFGVIVTTLGILKDGPGFDRETVDETLFGRKVEILENLDNHWFYVETDYGYRGYIHGMSLYMDEEDLEEWDKNARHIVDWNIVDTMKEPNYQSMRGTILTRGAVIRLTGKEEGDWLEIETPIRENYWLRKEFVGELVEENLHSEEDFRKNLVATAKSYLGSQYRWGGKSPIGIDCSGLSHISYLLNGVNIYRDAKIKEGYPVKEIERDRLREGDLLYWECHVAIYLGDDRYIHSTGEAGGVVINSLNPDHEDFREDLAQVESFASIF